MIAMMPVKISFIVTVDIIVGIRWIWHYLLILFFIFFWKVFSIRMYLFFRPLFLLVFFHNLHTNLLQFHLKIHLTVFAYLILLGGLLKFFLLDISFWSIFFSFRFSPHLTSKLSLLTFFEYYTLSVSSKSQKG